jgi:hypothetical protein
MKRLTKAQIDQTHPIQLQHRGVIIYVHDTPGEPISYYYNPMGCEFLKQGNTTEEVRDDIDAFAVLYDQNKILKLQKEIIKLTQEIEEIKNQKY